MHEIEEPPRPGRYALTGAERGQVWGICVAADGLFGEAGHERYELLGWVPEGPDVRGWVGHRVWLVPDDEAGPWLLRDAESAGRSAGTDSLVITGLDDYDGPPEGHRGPVRVHDGRRWLGTCREFTRLLPPQRMVPPLVLRGLAPSDPLRAALAKGTRRARDLGESAVQIHDDQSGTLAEWPLWAKISAWYPSAHGQGLIDLELDAKLLTPSPKHARSVWERWLPGPPTTLGAWGDLDTRRRAAWLDLVQERACRRVSRNRPTGDAFVLDGRHVTDEPGLYLALGEALDGPGGYFGGCLAALDDCLRDAFGFTAPATLLWRNAATAREHLSQTLTADGRPRDLFAQVLQVLDEGGVHVTLA